MRKVLLKLAETVTGTPRAFPVFELNKGALVCSMFRVHEWLFGREMNEDGKTFAIRLEGISTSDGYMYSFTWENYFACVEGLVRSFISRRVPKFKIVYLPQMQLAGIRARHGVSPFRFAVAFDVYTDGGNAPSATTLTWNHTTSGSNRFLAVLGQNGGGDLSTGVTYATISLTQAVKTTILAQYIYSYFLPNPASGTNSTVWSVSSNPGGFNGTSASYSGAQQSGSVDTGSLAEATTSGDRVSTVNVNTANSWLVSSYSAFIASPVSVVNGTARGAFPAGGSIADSNAGVGTGNQTIGYHWNSADTHMMVAMSIAPAAAGAVSTPFRTLLGVGK